MPYDFLFTFVTFNQQTADLEKKDYSLALSNELTRSMYMQECDEKTFWKKKQMFS